MSSVALGYSPAKSGVSASAPLPYYVTAYGAKGDGTTDDTAAIQAAITAAEAIKGVLFFPPGVYLISQTLVIDKRISVRGAGNGDSANNTNVAAATYIRKNADVVAVQVNASYTTLADFMVDSAVADTTDGIVVGAADATNGAGQAVLRDVSVYAVGGNGVNVKNGNVGRMDNVRAIGCGGHGVVLDSKQTSVVNVNAWTLTDVTATGNGGDGLHMELAASNTIVHATCEGNTGYGVYCNRASNFIRAYVESNTAGSVFLGASAFDCFLIIQNASNVPPVVNNGSNILFMQGDVPAKFTFTSAGASFPGSLTVGSTLNNKGPCLWNTDGAGDIGQTAGRRPNNVFLKNDLHIGHNLVHEGTGVGFYGVAPVTRPAALTQTYSTADRTLSAYTPNTQGTAYTGAADGEAKLADLNALRVAYENLRAFVEDLAQHHNAVVDDLQAYGLEQ